MESEVKAEEEAESEVKVVTMKKAEVKSEEEAESEVKAEMMREVEVEVKAEEQRRRGRDNETTTMRP